MDFLREVFNRKKSKQVVSMCGVLKGFQWLFPVCRVGDWVSSGISLQSDSFLAMSQWDLNF